VPSTLRRATGTHQQDLDNRFGYLRECAREFNVNGAILYVIRFCDTFEDEYILSSIQGFRTRIQAFLEMVG
jgi:benzoyl-CoA reductase/2-hydroxyglutaryl-CoA dehydratase subunit BcrC/BadD/HgdB